MSPALATLFGAFLGTGSRARPTPTRRLVNKTTSSSHHSPWLLRPPRPFCSPAPTPSAQQREAAADFRIQMEDTNHGPRPISSLRTERAIREQSMGMWDEQR